MAEERPSPRSLDGVTAFMGVRWDDVETVRLTTEALHDTVTGFHNATIGLAA